MKNHSKKVDALLIALVEIQESIENGLNVGEVAYLNDQYDYVKACFCREQDGDRQKMYFELFDEITEEEAISRLLNTIKWALNKAEWSIVGTTD